MSKINDGGPAYPHYAADGHADYRRGLSMRDHFAAQALAGDWAAQGGDMGAYRSAEPQENLVERASLYFRMADAMLAARAKGGDADG